MSELWIGTSPMFCKVLAYLLYHMLSGSSLFALIRDGIFLTTGTYVGPRGNPGLLLSSYRRVVRLL
jgi:hypothetical protein